MSENPDDPRSDPDDVDGAFDDPLSELDDPFAELADVGGEPIEEDAFVEMEFEGIDEAAVWEELTGPEPTDEPLESGAAAEGDGGEAIVPKSRYCEQCAHFSDPPAVECTLPGTEIRELVDNGSFRVHDCPVVEQRRGNARAVAFDIDPD